MNVKFEYISTKKPKWHIYHTNNYMGNGILTFKNNETGKQFQYANETQYDYSSYNDYVNFSDKVWNYLNKDKENMPFSEEEIKIINDKILNKREEIINFFKNNTDTTVILREPATEESQIDTYKFEAEHQAATAIVEANMAEFHAEQQELKVKQQQERETLIAEASRLTGRVEALNFVSKVAHGASLTTLKEIKESGVYKELPNIKTWEDYCLSIGYSRRYIDEQLENLSTLGDSLLELTSSFKLGTKDLRQLRKQVKAGNLEIKDAEVIIDGEVIPLDDKDELRDALDTLLKSKYKEIEELKDEIKTKESIIEDKEQDIKRLQASNNTFFKEKEQAERELKYLKAEGSINGIPLEDNPDFQSIKQCENESSILIERLTRLAEKDLSKFNKSMLGSTVIKIMNDMHNLHQELCSKGISDYFGDAFIDDDVIDAEDAVTTPNMFLKQQGNEDE